MPDEPNTARTMPGSRSLKSFTKALLLVFSGVLMVMQIATAAPEHPVSYGSSSVDGLEIFYREAGPKEAPTILLLHGLPSSSRMYQPLLESSLSETYHLIAPDYPGFGHSSWPNPKEFAYTFDSLAKVMQGHKEETPRNISRRFAI